MTLMDTKPISDVEKQAVWDAFYAGRPTRVPMTLVTNARVVHALSEWNPEGYSFEDAHHDPEIHLLMELRHQLYRRQVIGRYSDLPQMLPDVWEVGVFLYNVYEAAGFGATINFPEGQVPCTDPPPFMDEDRKYDVFDVDIEHPLDSPFWQGRLQLHRQMVDLAKDTTFEGRPVRVLPTAAMGTDGPVTVACNLRGTGFLMDLLAEPDYAQKLMGFIVDAYIHRARAFKQHWGDAMPSGEGAFIADDSCAMLSADQWQTLIKPHHDRIFEFVETELLDKPTNQRGIHLCGDASHLFASMNQASGVNSFDTGFPIDHGVLREQLGPKVMIQGGPEIQLLLDGQSEDVYQRTRDILQSGVMTGGQFVLREGNNLPPLVPDENLAAMRAANLEFGVY